MGREILTLHFGQAGVQIGSALWELFCIEHGLSSDGYVVQPTDYSQFSTFEHINALFNEGQKCWTPRAMLIDLEPTVIDEIRCGAYRQLWKPSCLINGKEDAANNYGRGNCTIGKLKLEEIMDCIHKLVEDTNNLAAFEIIHAHSGGTGSGLSTLVIDQLCDEYGKKFKFGTSVFPSAMYSQSTVDPYNAILNAHNTIETLDCDILVDNQTLFERCTRNLGIVQPSFSEINRLLAQMLSSIFLSHRFIYHGSQHADTTELLTNLIPYPRIHFPALFYAPILPRNQIEHDTLSVAELTKMAFSPDAQTIDFPCRRNLYMSCAMLYRGVTSPKHVYDALQLVKGTPSVGASFVDWCPTGFKVGLNSYPPASFAHSPLAASPRSICMLAGNLGMREAWHRNNLKFDILFSRRCFVHWFIGEGIEESEFLEARDDMAYLEQDYAELMGDTLPANEPTAEDRKANENENNVRMPNHSKNMSNLYHTHNYPSKKHMDDLSMARQSNNANTDRYYEIRSGHHRMMTNSVGNESHTTEIYSNAEHLMPPHPMRPNHSHMASKPRPRMPRKSDDAWNNSQSEINTYVSQNDGGNYFHQKPMPESQPNGYYFPSWNTNEESIEEPLHSNRILSPESGIFNTSISKHPQLAKEVNMNNPRLSESTNDTAFLPTNPIVQLRTNSCDPNPMCSEAITDYDDLGQWSQWGDDRRDLQPFGDPAHEMVQRANPNLLPKYPASGSNQKKCTSCWSISSENHIRHQQQQQHEQRQHSGQRQSQTRPWQPRQLSQQYASNLRTTRSGSLSNVNNIEQHCLGYAKPDPDHRHSNYLRNSISPTSGFGSMSEDPTACDLPACLRMDRSLHESVAQIQPENDDCLSSATSFQTAPTGQLVERHHRHRHHMHTNHSRPHHHHHHRHHHSAGVPRSHALSQDQSNQPAIELEQSNLAQGREQYLSQSMIAKRPIYEVSISSSPDESRLPTPILSTWSTLDAQQAEAQNES